MYKSGGFIYLTAGTTLIDICYFDDTWSTLEKAVSHTRKKKCYEIVYLQLLLFSSSKYIEAKFKYDLCLLILIFETEGTKKIHLFIPTKLMIVEEIRAKSVLMKAFDMFH